MEGYLIGLHKSPYHGFSVEFAEHRAYGLGDELKHLDWKLYGKTDRYYIKQYEEETNLRSYLLLDVSKSMTYSSHAVSKLDYGSYLAAALTYLMLNQRDAVSLTIFDDKRRGHVPPRSTQSHLNSVLGQLEKITPGDDTQIAQTLHELAEKIKKRGLVVLISDLLDEPDQVLSGLKHFRHRNHEVIVYRNGREHHHRTLANQESIPERGKGISDDVYARDAPAQHRLCSAHDRSGPGPGAKSLSHQAARNLLIYRSADHRPSISLALSMYSVPSSTLP